MGVNIRHCNTTNIIALYIVIVYVTVYALVQDLRI